MFDGQGHSLLRLKGPLREGVLFEDVTRQLVLQRRAELPPAQVGILSGYRLHEQVGRHGYHLGQVNRSPRTHGAKADNQEGIQHNPRMASKPANQREYHTNHLSRPELPAAATGRVAGQTGTPP